MQFDLGWKPEKGLFIYLLKPVEQLIIYWSKKDNQSNVKQKTYRQRTSTIVSGSASSVLERFKN